VTRHDYTAGALLLLAFVLVPTFPPWPEAWYYVLAYLLIGLGIGLTEVASRGGDSVD